MKPRLSIGLALLICFVLVVFGLVYGDVSGYQDERAQVDALLTGDDGLMTVVGYRAADALNLCVVADRHLSGDVDVAALREAAQTLQAGTDEDPATVKKKDDALSAAFTAVAVKLNASASVTASTRDTQYLSMLTDDFSKYGRHEIFDTYNRAAEAFNEELNAPVLGDVARFFGVGYCRLYA